MNPGDRVRVDRDAASYEGVLMPSTTDDHLVVKLDGGYNVGVDADAVPWIHVRSYRPLDCKPTRPGKRPIPPAVLHRV